MTEDQRNADALVAGGTMDTKAARDLEKRLAKAGDDTRVQNVRKRREEMDVERAVAVLGNAQSTPREMLELGKSLMQYRQVGYARRLLTLACERVTMNKDSSIFHEIFQKAAVYTYKDPDLPLDWKLDRAYEILGETQSLAETVDPETLGIAGAILKRKWEVDGRRQNLERSLYYYLKGYAQGAPVAEQADVVGYLRKDKSCVLDASKDRGYTGINAAFVLDVLAAQEEDEARRVGLSAKTADERREAARLIRAEIARSVPPLIDQPANAWLKDEWWFYATIGEALFGLGRYLDAQKWLVDEPKAAGLHVGFGVRSSAGLQVPEWEYETTARQLARLGRLQEEAARTGSGKRERMTEQEFEQTNAGQALKMFLNDDHRAVASAYRGKFGLGLSGGGFRASLFHIGVLARLAEIGVLSQVEVLSCVSGGSIIGAYYYLELRRLLQTKADGDIKPKDYVDIVKRIEEQFLAGVQRNIRTRVLAELGTNLKMIFSARYSRTLRVGELYERELYSRVEDGDDGKSPVTGPRWLPDGVARLFGFNRRKRLLKDLRIFPRVEGNAEPPKHDADFKPSRDNWRRANKVPNLVLNACSLNSGHNWQFTASFMGEPPVPIQADIDCNYRLRRFYLDKGGPRKAPPVTLGQAVGASSCVPGLFEPLILDGLYTDDPARPISVRLVDGGVCDNQGIATLFEQDCNVMLVSDGSGQMDAQDAPSVGLIGVLARADGILQARVRETQYVDVAARRRARLLRGLMFVHLKQDLAGRALPWRDCPPDQKQSDVYDWKFDPRAENSGMTSYGVARDMQGKLAAVRTDLDSFSHAEAYALMASGYQMTREQFRRPEPPVRGCPEPDAPVGNWKFRALEAALAGGERKEKLAKLLDAARSPAFKIWQLSPVLIALKWLLLAAAAVGVIGAFVAMWRQPLLPKAARDLTFATVGEWALRALGMVLLAAVVNALIGKARGGQVMRVIRWRDTLKHIAIGVGMSTIGWLVARLHLHVFDRWYLRYGRAALFAKPTGRPAPASEVVPGPANIMPG